MLQKSLKELQKMDYDLKASDSTEKEKLQQVDFDINDYKEVFAEDYCRNLKADMEAQVNFIERLEEKTREESSDLSTLVDYCAE